MRLLNEVQCRPNQKRNKNNNKKSSETSIHLEGKKKVGSSTKERWELLLLLLCVHTLMSRMKREEHNGMELAFQCVVLETYANRGRLAVEEEEVDG
jgi:predicted transcriptional regulator